MQGNIRACYDVTHACNEFADAEVAELLAIKGLNNNQAAGFRSLGLQNIATLTTRQQIVR